MATVNERVEGYEWADENQFLEGIKLNSLVDHLKEQSGAFGVKNLLETLDRVRDAIGYVGDMSLVAMNIFMNPEMLENVPARDRWLFNKLVSQIITNKKAGKEEFAEIDVSFFEQLKQELPEKISWFERLLRELITWSNRELS